MSLIIEPMTLADYDTVFRLWESLPGIGLSAADSKQGIQQYLERNPGLSFVAKQEGKVVGAVLCGHDGRRGFLHHLAVEASQQRKGVGRQLVEACMSALKARSIDKCHIFVYGDNSDGMAFWQSQGWQRRADLAIMSRETKTNQK